MKSNTSSLLLCGSLLFTAACASILGIRPPGRHAFEHRTHVLEGIHCSRCHAGTASTGDEGPLHLPSTQDCLACHEKPHDDHECSGCHGLPQAKQGAEMARTHLRFEHRTHMPRVHGDCVRCHVDIANGAEILRPRMATCGSCHAHEKDLAQDRCDPCHVNLRDEGVRPDDHLIHAGNFVREHGVRAAAQRQLCMNCHSERFCLGCHGTTAALLPERTFFDDPTRLGVHRAGFVSRHGDEARADPGLCSTCHTPSVCSSCHAREGIAAKNGRTNPHPGGWLGPRNARNDHGPAAFREPEVCASCHGGAGEALCIGCHKVGGIGGTPHAPGFRSSRRKTIDEPCRRCHEGAL